MREKLKLLDMDEKLMNRSVNEAFSGGEKKRNEILQMAVLEPKLAILDETDSGPGHRRAANRRPGRERDAQPGSRHARGHALSAAAELHRAGPRSRAGRRAIVRSGGPELALELEETGYATRETGARSATPV